MLVNRIRRKAARYWKKSTARYLAGLSADGLAERLGYPATAKLLIIHADDLGLTHSVNSALVKAIEGGCVNSGSVMVPCRGFPEAAAHAREHPQMDVGVHLTLNSEWKAYRWGSILPRNEVPSLRDKRDFLHASREELARCADPRDVERELRAQVELARASGINPTHLDTHMLSLFETKPLFEAYLRVARDYGIPAMVPREYLLKWQPHLVTSLKPEDVLIDRMIIANSRLPEAQWRDFYSRTIETLDPGVTQIIVHLAYDDEEMRALTADHPTWGAARWQRDLDFFMSADVKRLLEKHNVHLIAWREMGEILRQ